MSDLAAAVRACIPFGLRFLLLRFWFGLCRRCCCRLFLLLCRFEIFRHIFLACVAVPSVVLCYMSDLAAAVRARRFGRFFRFLLLRFRLGLSRGCSYRLFFLLSRFEIFGKVFLACVAVPPVVLFDVPYTGTAVRTPRLLIRGSLFRVLLGGQFRALRNDLPGSLVFPCQDQQACIEIMGLHIILALPYYLFDVIDGIIEPFPVKSLPPHLQKYLDLHSKMLIICDIELLLLQFQKIFLLLDDNPVLIGYPEGIFVFLQILFKCLIVTLSSIHDLHLLILQLSIRGARR